MESKTRESSGFNSKDSVARLKEILSGADTNYEETESMPRRDKLTFTNGFYVPCTAIWVDMRASSDLPEKYNRPKLAKLYRAYLSELVAVMHGSERCVEVNIQGDAVWGVFETPKKPHIDSAFETAVLCRSAVDLLNRVSGKQSYGGYEPIKVGAGVSYGQALVIKAGYSGSGLNDLVYMGDVVNEASNLSSYGSKSGCDPVVISRSVHHNLKDDYKELCRGPIGLPDGTMHSSATIRSLDQLEVGA